MPHGRDPSAPAIVARGLTFQPAGAAGPTPLRDLSFEMAPGDAILVAGPTGSGKSTLLTLLAGFGARFPEPRVGGTLAVVFPGDNGASAGDALPTPRPGRVAWVRQEPGDGLVAIDVLGAVAMPLEEQGRPRGETLARVEAALQRFDVLHLAARDVATLSMGERRRVALAGVEALDPGLVLLDEPLADLDPAGTRQVVTDLYELRKRRTVVIAEHRAAQIRPLVDQVLHIIPERAPASGAALPRAAPDPEASATLRASGLMIKRGGRILLEEASFFLDGGVWGLLGPNGSGKTTLIATLTGLLRPESGEVEAAGRHVWLAGRGPRRERLLRRRVRLDVQEPHDSFFMMRVAEELAAPLVALRLMDRKGADARARAMLRHAGLGDLADRAPFHLSGGEARRVQMLGSLLVGPSLWFLDEPTHGLDPQARAALTATVRAFAAAGGCVVVATHEPDILPSETRWLFLPGDGRLLTGDAARPGADGPRAAGYVEGDEP